MREALHFPRLPALSVLFQYFSEPQVCSAVRLNEIMRALYPKLGVPPKEKHGELLGVINGASEWIAVEPHLSTGGSCRQSPLKLELTPPKGR